MLGGVDLTVGGKEGLSLSLCGRRSVGHSLGGRIACSERINLIGRGWGWRCQAYFWACTAGGFEHGACEEMIRAREVVLSLCDARNMEERQTKKKKSLEGWWRGAKIRRDGVIYCGDGALRMEPCDGSQRESKKVGCFRATI